ncbi:MAG: TolB family protein, partial [Gemmatimonadales bacterium]
EIYVMNADGSAQTRLTNDPELDSYPVWSPDGGFIAFRSDRDGNIEIFAMAADGSHPQNLTQNGAVDCHPTWTSTAAGGVVTASRVGAVGGPALAQRPRGITPSVGVPVTSCLGR